MSTCFQMSTVWFFQEAINQPMVCSLLCVGWVFLFPISRHFLQGEKTPFHEGFLGMVSQQPEAPTKYWLNQVKENYEYMYVNIYTDKYTICPGMVDLPIFGLSSVVVNEVRYSKYKCTSMHSRWAKPLL